MRSYIQYLSNFQDYLDNSTAEECVSAFFRYLKVNMCPLNDLALIDTRVAIQCGLVLSTINPFHYNKGIMRAGYKKFMETGNFDSIEFSIMSSMSLFLAIAAKNIQVIEHKDKFQHDFDISWSDHIVQAEVIRMTEEADFSLRSVSVDDENNDPKTSSMLIIDVNPMPEIFPELGNYLSNFFPTWPHISGVTLFVNHFSDTKVGWKTHILVNEHARRPFDEETFKQLQRFKKIGGIVSKQF